MPWSPRVDDAQPLDAGWLRAHPLPPLDPAADKNSRGSVLVVGGCASCPGGITLTAEAAFRAGAGKVTIATIASMAQAIGLAFPEAGVIALPETADGEIAEGAVECLAELAERHDSIALGPAMTDVDAAGLLVGGLLPRIPLTAVVVLDAAALRAAPGHAELLMARDGKTILTPHAGEMAAMLGWDHDDVLAEPFAALDRAAHRFGATILLKGPVTMLREQHRLLAYKGGGVGLATGGSGDVLAGVIAAVAARGLAPLPAAAWGIWAHGEAGRRLAENVGPVGYLARELLPLIPGLLHAV